MAVADSVSRKTTDQAGEATADVFISHVTWEEVHFEPDLTVFNMKEKKDLDVSFNTTLSDVSCANNN